MIPKDKETKVKETFRFYKGLILDVAEQQLGSDSEQWQILRRQLLKFLSDERGLESQILQILKESDQ